jgi:hypothetical protein
VVQLLDGDVRTREVLGWRGLHVIHTYLSSCSQKLCIFLNLKGIEWESRLVDLMAGENLATANHVHSDHRDALFRCALKLHLLVKNYAFDRIEFPTPRRPLECPPSRGITDLACPPID